MNVFIQVSDDGGKTLRDARRAATSTSTTTRSGSTPTTPTTTSSAATAASTRASTAAANWRLQAEPADHAVLRRRRATTRGPFYNVYGGTQDNNTLGGPVAHAQRARHHQRRLVRRPGRRRLPVHASTRATRTSSTPSRSTAGSSASTAGPASASTIQPQPAPGEPPLRWNWDSPLAHQPAHAHAALLRRQPRLPQRRPRRLAGRAVSRRPDAAARPRQAAGDGQGLGRRTRSPSTPRPRSTATSSRWPSRRKKEGLLYVGTDDGLIQVTEDGGKSWRKVEQVPRRAGARPTSARWSPRSTTPDTVYAAFDNHKNGDFKPYLLKSTDAGADVDARSPATCPRAARSTRSPRTTSNPNLLFVGTEFGLFFTLDGGKKWLQLKGGLPTIAVRDLAIQKRENDLVVGTFGRGFYVLDDYTPLRAATPALLRDRGGAASRCKKAAAYIPQTPLGLRGKAFLGETLLHRGQPAVRRRLHLLPEGGAEDEAQEPRQDAEKEADKKGADDRLPDARGAARGGARGGPRGRPDGEGRGGQRRAPADRPREGRHPARRLGPPLPGRQPHPHDPAPHGQPLLRSARGPARRSGPVQRELREAGGRCYGTSRRAAELRRSRRSASRR